MNARKLDQRFGMIWAEVNLLRQQVQCGVRGHQITVRHVWDNDAVSFRCMECRLDYYRQGADLTPHERKLVDAVKQK